MPHENSPISSAFQNQEVLLSLGLKDKPLIEPKEVRRKKDKSDSKCKKRKFQEVTPELGDYEENQPKRIEALNESDAGPRRSTRNSGKKVDYTSEQQRRDAVPVAYSSGVKTTENTGPLGSEGGGKRIHNP